MKEIKLLQYQENAVKNINKCFEDYNAVLGIAFCGAGKTIILAKLIKSISINKKIVILVHRKSLIRQIKNSLRLFELFNNFNITLETYIKFNNMISRKETLHTYDYLIIDECHLAGNPTYQKIINSLKTANENLKILGLTATPTRKTNVKMNNIFEKYIHLSNMEELVKEKRVIFPTYIAGTTSLNSKNLKVKSGEYDTNDNDVAILKIKGNIIDSYKEHLNDKTCIVFCPAIKSCQEVAELFNENGIPADFLTGSTPQPKREDILFKLENRELKVVCCVNLLIEGIDIPNLQGAILLRATTSKTIFYQSIGRVIRYCDNKETPIIIDLVENWTRFSCLENYDEINWSPEKFNNKQGKGAENWKCSKCNTINSIKDNKICKKCQAKKEVKTKDTILIMEKSSFLKFDKDSFLVMKMIYLEKITNQYSNEWLVFKVKKILNLSMQDSINNCCFSLGFKPGWKYHIKKSIEKLNYKNYEKPTSFLENNELNYNEFLFIVNYSFKDSSFVGDKKAFFEKLIQIKKKLDINVDIHKKSDNIYI